MSSTSYVLVSSIVPQVMTFFFQVNIQAYQLTNMLQMSMNNLIISNL